MSRIKRPAVPVPQSRDEFEALAVRLAETKRKIERIADEAADAIAQTKLKAKQAAAESMKEAEALWSAVAAFAEAHRAELLPKDRKSVAIAAGVIGWRLSNPAIEISADEQDLIQRLDRDGLGRFLRETVEIDKAALLAEPTVAETIDGIAIRQVESLFFQPLDLDKELTFKPTKAREAA
ncbi:MAG TPA: host-nuclease inhibitor Gam family protein [Aliidongia sp.]|nr:host-nuclease inhibitor Gam family protein [Aliidongia sp.]